MKNKLSDLNDHLFAQLERLSDEDLTAEQVETESERAKAIIGVSDQIIGAAEIQFKAAALVAKHGAHVRSMMPESISGAKTIEHKPVQPKIAQRPKTAEDIERAEADARRARREKAEMREDMRVEKGAEN